MQELLSLIKRHKAGETVGVFSVCSAHPWVLDAAIRHAAAGQTAVLIEATSNQVNQFGGYTGLRPADFRDRVWQMADENGLPRENVWLGGDHLGPNAWQDRPAEDAMILAERMIADYVQAGFRKIHLDCSMSCAGDPSPLGDEEVARRAARLCAIAEEAWRTAGGEAPLYVIGTEVPVPGGAQEALHDVPATSPEAVAATLEAHRDAWRRAGLDAAWARVIALVVQPGVEFDHQSVVHYRAAPAGPLSRYIEHRPGLVFEAHSTDYQTPDALRQLVRDHFAILKVGPALTFALREALFALAHIETEWIDEPVRSRLMDRLDDAMRRQPAMWQRYYHGDPRQQLLLRRYSLSDRVRYYWPQQDIEQAVDRLVANLRHRPAPLGLLSQYLPEQARLCLAGELPPDPQEWVYHHIDKVLCDYAQACRPTK